MKIIKLILTIKNIAEGEINCYVSNNVANNQITYFPEKDVLTFVEENSLAEEIIRNKLQFSKIMRSAISGNVTVGQTINCVFIEGFTFLNDGNFYKYIRVNRLTNILHITTSETRLENIHQIYADGSTAENKQSGFGGFIEFPDGTRQIFQKSFKSGSNNLMELLAVTEGIKLLNDIDIIRINTDSRFVIRGLIQWVHYWRHNNWETAYGSKVKFANQWQLTDKLCEGKLIEFNWIKGHSGNTEQTFCHNLAKESTKKHQ